MYVRSESDHPRSNCDPTLRANSDLRAAARRLLNRPVNAQENGGREPGGCRAAPAHRHSAAALKLLHERGETLWDRLFNGIVLDPETPPDCAQPWPSGQNVTRFGLPPLTLPALAATDSYGSRCGLACVLPLSAVCPLLLRSFSRSFLEAERTRVLRAARAPNTFPQVSGIGGSPAAIL